MSNDVGVRVPSGAPHSKGFTMPRLGEILMSSGIGKTKSFQTIEYHSFVVSFKKSQSFYFTYPVSLVLLPEDLINQANLLIDITTTTIKKCRYHVTGLELEDLIYDAVVNAIECRLRVESSLVHHREWSFEDCETGEDIFGYKSLRR